MTLNNSSIVGRVYVLVEPREIITFRVFSLLPRLGPKLTKLFETDRQIWITLVL